MWGKDLSHDYKPYEAGLDRFVRLNKAPQSARGPREANQENGVPNRFILRVPASGCRPIGNDLGLMPKAVSSAARTAGLHGHALARVWDWAT